MLTGCVVSEIDRVQKGLRTVSARNGVQQAIFRENNLARRPLFVLVQNMRRDGKRNQIFDSSTVIRFAWP
jgi:hypothetical protein